MVRLGKSGLEWVTMEYNGLDRVRLGLIRLQWVRLGQIGFF